MMSGMTGVDADGKVTSLIISVPEEVVLRRVR
jgi:hypothetical protein